MSLILTYWEDSKSPDRTEDDFDGLLEIRLKSVKQLPALIASMPVATPMISIEYSGDHKRNGKISTPSNPRRFKELWRKGQSIPMFRPAQCPLCGCVKIDGTWSPANEEQEKYENETKGLAMRNTPSYEDIDPRHDDLHLSINGKLDRPYHCDICGNTFVACKHWGLSDDENWEERFPE